MGLRGVLSILGTGVVVVGLTSCSTGATPSSETVAVPAAAAHGYPADEIDL